VVTSPEAEAEVGRGGDLLPRPRPGVGRGGDLLPRPRLRLSPGVGRGRAPCSPEAELGRGRDLLLLVLPWWLAQ
jgi:hypothetical protein